MDFCWVTLRVKDLEASLAFFQGCWASRRRRFGLPGGTRSLSGLWDKPQIVLLCDPKARGGFLDSAFRWRSVNSLEACDRALQKNKIH